MKKIFKIFSIVILTVLCLLYAAFLLIPPIFNKVFDFDKYKSDIQKIAKDSSKLNLDYSKIKIFTTPLLSFGVSIEDIKITLPDNSELFKTPKIKAGIALPSLFTLTVKTSKCSVENPYINLEIKDGKQYKIVNIIEDIINENSAKPKQEETPAPETVQKIAKIIKIKVPSVKITNFEALVNDIKTNHNLKLKGNELILGYNSANNTFKIKSDAKLLSDDKENISANINISSSLPAFEESTEQKDPEEKIAIPFVNPVEIYQTYDLKTNIDSKLKIRNTKNGLIMFGYFDVDNLNLKLSQIRLPDSYLHTKFHGKTITYDADIYAKNEEKITLSGLLKYGKNPKITADIKSNEIHFKNLVELSEGLFDSLNIKNNLAQIQTTGYLISNAKIETDFKKLKSQGSITVKDGSFVNPKTNIGIKDAQVNLVLDDNILNIQNTSALINNSKLSATGTIDTKSNTDIKFDMDNLSLSELYNAFAPKELKNQYTLNRANLTAHIDIKGKLDSLNAKLDAALNNLNLSDAKKTMFVTNEGLNVTFSADEENISGIITNSGFKFNMPQIKTTGAIKKAAITLNQDSITINPFDFIYNNSSKINIKGNITNYLKNPIISFFADGKISTQNIAQTLGKEIAYYVPQKGSVPLKVSISGDSKEQNIIAQIFANQDNYISPIILNSLYGGASLISGDIKIKGNKIKIQDSGLFKVQNLFNDDLKSNLTGASKIVDFTAILDNGHINLFRINIPNEEQGKIAIFKNSSFKTKGKVTLNGTFEDLNFGGDIKIQDANIPELFIKANSIDLDFVSNALNLKAKEVNINDSSLDGSLKADLKPAKVFKISNIEIKSDSLNADKMMLSLNEATKYLPPSSQNSSVSSSNADIPILAEGKFDIKKLISGNITIENIKGNLGIKDNFLTLSNLNCKAFEGDVSGIIKMNLLTSLSDIKLSGKNLDANKALVDAANMKDTISGNLKFATDISLKGATYEEQMRTLKGNVNFELKDGQYGPFAKLENFFLAENIRENALFKNTIGAILVPLATIDSSHYENLSGKVSFNGGVANLENIKSQGDILCVLINGKMNLLTNKIDSTVRARLASSVSDSLGPIAMLNPVNLVKSTPGLNIASAKLFSAFSQVVDEKEYKEIPDFSKSHSDEYATKFQVLLNGDVAKPLTLVKSFKWLALQEDIDKAQEFQQQLVKQELIDKLQSEYEENNKLKVGVEKILQMDTTAPEVKKILTQEVIKTKEQTTQTIQQNSEQAKAQLQEKVQNAIEEKKQEQEQKLLDAKEQLKSKLQQKITLPTTIQTKPEAVDSETTLGD